MFYGQKEFKRYGMFVNGDSIGYYLEHSSAQLKLLEMRNRKPNGTEDEKIAEQSGNTSRMLWR